MTNPAIQIAGTPQSKTAIGILRTRQKNQVKQIFRAVKLWAFPQAAHSKAFHQPPQFTVSQFHILPPRKSPPHHRL
jgi:hypothetical protein